MGTTLTESYVVGLIGLRYVFVGIDVRANLVQGIDPCMAFQENCSVLDAPAETSSTLLLLVLSWMSLPSDP